MSSGYPPRLRRCGPSYCLIRRGPCQLVRVRRADSVPVRGPRTSPGHSFALATDPRRGPSPRSGPGTPAPPQTAMATPPRSASSRWSRPGAADAGYGGAGRRPGLAEVDRMLVVPDAPAGIAVQPVHWPARGDPDRVPGEPDYLEPGPAGPRREVHCGRPGARPRVGGRKCPESRISKSHDQRKSDYPTHLHAPECDSARNRRGTTSGLPPFRSLRIQPASASPLGAEPIRG